MQYVDPTHIAPAAPSDLPRCTAEVDCQLCTIGYFAAEQAATGFAYRPTDNVGVQYGLNALNQDWITVADFLELNAAIGGFDVDGRPQSQRMAADPDALARV